MKRSPLVTKKLIIVSPLSEVQKAQALLQARFRCQICNAPGTRLKAHIRTSGQKAVQAHDMLVLCETCYDLAQAGKRKRMQGKMARRFHLAYLLALIAVGIIAIDLLARLLPTPLFLLTLVCMYTVYLLEYLSTRWL